MKVYNSVTYSSVVSCYSLLLFVVLFSYGCCPQIKIKLGAKLKKEMKQNHSLNIVLIVLDGIRVQEFLNSKTDNKLIHIHSKKRKQAKKSTIIRDSCTISNPYGSSLPAYADILSGVRQSNVRTNNFKSRLNCPSFIDRLIQEGHSPKDFAVFASWQHIENILSQDYSKDIYIDTGYRKKLPKPRWKDARFDKNLQADILSYFKKSKHRPRFISIIFNDTDEWGHLGNYKNYLKAFEAQNKYIKELYEYFESQKKYKNKTVYLITTDHGRGLDKQWKSHGIQIDGARDIWLALHVPTELVERPRLLSWIKKYLLDDCSHLSMARLIYTILSY